MMSGNYLANRIKLPLFLTNPHVGTMTTPVEAGLNLKMARSNLGVNRNMIIPDKDLRAFREVCMIIWVLCPNMFENRSAMVADRFNLGNIE